jgi:hypothetical protein
MATISAIFTPDFASTVGLTNGRAAIGAGAAGSGLIQIGKHRLFMINGIDTTTPANVGLVSFTMGLSTGTKAIAPTINSPVIALNNGMIFDTGDMYDQIWLGNFNNLSTNGIFVSVLLLSKF